MAATATAISVFFVSNLEGLPENFVLHRFLSKDALQLANLTLELTNFRGANDLVLGADGFTPSLEAIRRLQVKRWLGAMPFLERRTRPTFLAGSTHRPAGFTLRRTIAAEAQRRAAIRFGTLSMLRTRSKRGHSIRLNFTILSECSPDRYKEVPEIGDWSLELFRERNLGSR